MIDIFGNNDQLNCTLYRVINYGKSLLWINKVDNYKIYDFYYELRLLIIIGWLCAMSILAVENDEGDLWNFFVFYFAFLRLFFEGIFDVVWGDV